MCGLHVLVKWTWLWFMDPCYIDKRGDWIARLGIHFSHLPFHVGGKVHNYSRMTNQIRKVLVSCFFFFASVRGPIGYFVEKHKLWWLSCARVKETWWIGEVWLCCSVVVDSLARNRGDGVKAERDEREMGGDYVRRGFSSIFLIIFYSFLLFCFFISLFTESWTLLLSFFHFFFIIIFNPSLNFLSLFQKKFLPLKFPSPFIIWGQALFISPCFYSLLYCLFFYHFQLFYFFHMYPLIS